MFLRHKFGKIANKLLKTALADFYSTEDLAASKKLLVSHIQKLSGTIKHPHLPQRRDSAKDVTDDEQREWQKALGINEEAGS